MAHWLPVALAAGAASGLLHVSGAGGAPLGMLLNLFTPLPLFMAGLGIGLGGLAAAGLAGALVVGVLAEPLQALVYGAAHPLCAIVLCRQAMLARPGPGGDLLWYPGGRLICWLMGIIFAYLLVVAAIIEVFHDGLTATLDGVMQDLAAAMGERLSAEGKAALLEMAPLLPAFVAGYYMLNVVLNAALAQHVLRRSGRNIRPSIALARLRLPPKLLWLLPASLAAGWLVPPLAPFAYTLAFIVCLTYFLLGLAVVHAFLQNRPHRSAALFSFYVMLVLLMVLFSAVGVLLVGLGVAEQIVGLRRRFGGGGTEDA